MERDGEPPPMAEIVLHDSENKPFLEETAEDVPESKCQCHIQIILPETQWIVI